MANEKKYASLQTLQTFLDNLRATFSALSHKHTVSDLTDYAVDTALSSTSTNPVQNKVVNEEFEAVSQAMKILENAIDGKTDSSHNHNDLYYTIEQINDMAFITVDDIDTICGTTISLEG